MKKEEREWLESVPALLPEEFTQELPTSQDFYDELGKPRIIYYRESVPERYLDYSFLYPVRKEKHHWAASCLCTECRERFYLGWLGGKEKSIYATVGEDGATYECTDETGFMTDSFDHGHQLRCPKCDEQCVLTHTSDIGNGRAYRTQLATLLNINGTAAIIYWFAERRITKSGYTPIDIYPRDAVVISPEGNIYKFSHCYRFMNNEVWMKEWVRRSRFSDPDHTMYNLGGNMYDRGYGSFYSADIPDLTGSTGEKTGIEYYFGLSSPATYLTLWHWQPKIENLVKTGWGEMVEEIAEMTAGGYDKSVEFGKLKIDWNESKPNRMLHLPKEEYKALAGWGARHLELFNMYRETFPDASAVEFNETANLLLWDSVKSLIRFPERLEKFYRYFCKQAEREHTDLSTRYVDMYIDYRKFLSERLTVTGAGEPTAIEKFPPNLRRAHDAELAFIQELNREKEKKENAELFQRFAGVAETLLPLEWSDGEICIVIPRCPADLTDEGRTLNHCVGRYSNEFITGNPIFFVRHARRPERSWYTLNERITGKTVKRIQLHGYSNEYAHGKNLKIPQKVFDFVDRWEREILAPWLQQQYKKKERKTA